MPCRSCIDRQRMIAEAKARDGIKGVLRVLPAVGRHLMSNPPTTKDKDDGPKAEG